MDHKRGRRVTLSAGEKRAYDRGYRAGRSYVPAHERPVVKDPSRRRNPRGLAAHRRNTEGRRISRCRRGCTCCGAHTLHVPSGLRLRCLKCGNLNPPHKKESDQ